MSPGTQNMKTGPYLLVTPENEYGRAKHENGTRRPHLPPEKSQGAQNMKIGLDTIDTFHTAEKES
jgi:hypothetical protein